MDKPIERYKLPRLIQEVIVLDSPLFVQEMKFAIENLSEKELQIQMASIIDLTTLSGKN